MRFCACLICLTAALSAQELAITGAAVSDRAAGTPVPQERTFLAGERVYVSFRIAGFRAAGDSSRIFLEYSIEAMDSLGNAFEQAFEGRMITATRRTETPPIRYGFELPRAPWPGEGKFRITVRDRIAETTAREEIGFQIGSDLPDKGGAFAVTALRIFSSEYSDQPVTDTAFRPGDSVWCRFVLSGYRMQVNHLYKVSYGVSLRDRSGRVIFSEPDAVSDTKESFYPRWYLPGLASVRLEPGIRPGVYKLSIAATDQIGNQNAAAETTIRVQ